MKKLFMMSVIITSIISFAETPVTIHSYGYSDLENDITFMTSYDTIKVMVGNQFVDKKIDSIDINFVPTKHAPKETKVAINMRLHVEGKYCDFIFWIKSKSRPFLNEHDVAMDISNGTYTINYMIAQYMDSHNQYYAILSETKKVEKKNLSNKKG